MKETHTKPLAVYNTLSRKKEEFKPLQKTVTMYSCGPTVYSPAHIGNMRAYIFMDSIRRVIKFNGYKIKGVLNITDVGHLMSDADDGEDKMAAEAVRQNKSPYEIADEITALFMADLNALNIGVPEIVAKATAHIDEMLNFVTALCDKGYAYETSDGIYFDISALKEYGGLSRQKLDEKEGGARISVNTEKRHPADFALWKKAPPQHIMQWPSKWGQGYPGWHIECSAIARKFFGASFDIHTGGVDHIPIHHENEFAQSKALDGADASARYWMHGEFMQVNGGKMSKSLGNVYTVSDLAAKGCPPLAFRYFCLNTHYRKAVNFTFDALDGAAVAYKRLLSLVAEHKASAVVTPFQKLADYKEKFISAVNDDFNIPLGLGVLWTLLREPFSKDIFDLAIEFDACLGLNLAKAEPLKLETENIPEAVKQKILERANARANKDFALSDKLRDEIAALGWAVIDTPKGQEAKKL